jgi:hypothetical protein
MRSTARVDPSSVRLVKRTGTAAAILALACTRCSPALPPAALTYPPAAPPPIHAPATEKPENGLVVVVSGGVSLGAYQGGYLYALSEELKREGVRPALYVGASAGTINAVLMALEMCRPAVPNPEDSSLRSVWMNASLAQLRSGTKNTSPTAIFPQDGVRQIAETTFAVLLGRQALSPDCDFVFSGETSRIRPRAIEVDGNQTVPDIQEPFTIRITVGQDGYPRIHNYVPEDEKSATQALLPFPAEQDDASGRAQALGLLIDLVLASSAFPAAFPQVELPHCMAGPKDGVRRHQGPTDCGALPIYRDTPFADGGILDNTPVGLAIRIARQGWVPGAEPGAARAFGAWGPAHTSNRNDNRPKGLSYLLVDMDNDVYDALPSGPEARSSFVGFAGAFAGAFLDAARGRALYDTIEQYPELHQHFAISALRTRLASRYLADFFGFFDSRLRDFDAVGGMYDAATLIASGGLGALLAGQPMPDPRAPAKEDGRAQLANLSGSSLVWSEFACLAQAYGPVDASQGYAQCASRASASPRPSSWQRVDQHDLAPDFDSFVELAQASLDELYSQCKCAASLSGRPLGPACADLLARSATPPRLGSNSPLDADWQEHCGPDAGGQPTLEDPLAYAERRLAHYGFAGASAAQTTAMVRSRVGTLADDLLGRQPAGTERVAETLVSPVAVDGAFGYRPALHELHLVAGPEAAEAGYSVGRQLRAGGMVQYKGWRGGSAATPLAGIDWVLPLSSTTLQTEAFARVGFQFGTVGPNDIASSCSGGFGGHAERCIVGQGGLALTVLELARVQALWEQTDAAARDAFDHLVLEMGIQLNWPSGGSRQ